jgi:hypothetical protein
MRNLLFFALIAMSLVFTNCKKDPVSSDPMVGKWKLESLYLKNGKNVTVDGTETLELRVEMQGKNMNSSIELKSDGTYASKGSYLLAYSFYDGQDLAYVFDIPIALDGTSGTYLRTGNSFKVVDSNGATSDATVVSETKDLITLEVQLYQTQSAGTAISTLSGTIVEVLKRQ